MKRFLIVLLLAFLGLFLFLQNNASSSDTEQLHEQLNEIEQLFAKRNAQSESVSKVDVAWHLDHMLKTVNRISQAIEASKPQAYESPSFNMIRLMSLGFGFIPRGRGQAPESVRPPETISTEDLETQLEEARRLIDMANALPENAHFDHPVFGTLNKPATLRFLEVHTQHHLKIVSDIIAASE